MSFEIKNGVLKKYRAEDDETEVDIPWGVTEIAEYAFGKHGFFLTRITLPEGLVRIDIGAFIRCFHLKEIILPESLKSLGICAFQDCPALERVVFPETLTDIGYSAFGHTAWLEARQKENPLVIVNGVLIDGQKCTGSVTVPAGVKRIGERAFLGCQELTEVILPESVTEISAGAFGLCPKLNSIRLPENLYTIGDGGIWAFSSTPWQTALQERAKTEPFVIEGGILFGGTECTGEVTVPEGVKIIYHGAFKGCEALTKLTLPESLTTICAAAFQGCTNLTEIVLPESVTILHWTAFGGGIYPLCENLRVIKLRPDDPALFRDYGTIKNLSVCIRTAWEMLHTGDYAVKLENTVKYPFLLLHYLYTSDETAEAYIRKNFSRIMKECITYGDLPVIRFFVQENKFFTKKNIDKFIQQAVDEKQTQIEACLNACKEQL